MLLYFNQSIKPLELNGPFWYIRENKRIDHSWPTGCLVIPFMQKAEAGTYHLTGQLVIIIALHYHRKASAASANNEVAKTAKKGKVIVRIVEGESLYLCWVVTLSICPCMHMDLWTHVVTLVIIWQGLCWTENSSMTFCCFAIDRQDWYSLST